MQAPRRSPLTALAVGCALVCFCSLAGCKKGPKRAVPGAASSSASSGRVSDVPSPGATGATADEARPPGPLCAAEVEGSAGPSAPTTETSLVTFPGHPPPQPLAPGRWQWVNLWATWCKPCRKEIPLLLQWRQRLQGSMDIVFYSVDDASRSIRKFLGAQPDEGLRATFWLKPGPMRKSWLAEAGLPETPRLPSHLLVDPKGRVRCIVTGAISDSDFEQVQALAQRAQ